MPNVRTVLGLLLLGSPVAAQALNYDVVWTRMGDRIRCFSVYDGSLVRDIPGVPGGGWGMAIDAQRNVWSTDYSRGQNTIRKYDRDGNLLGIYSAGQIPVYPESSVGPVAIDRQGFVYIGDPRPSSSRITKIDNNGAPVTSWNGTGGSVRNLAVDPDGNLWAVTYYGPGGGALGHIEKFTPNGVSLWRYDVVSATPNGLYVDEWGRVFVTHVPDYLSYRVYNLSGTQIGSGATASGLDLGGLCVAPNRRLWMVEFFFGNRVEIFSAANTPVVNYNLPRAGGGCSVDALGNCWIATFDEFSAGTPLELIVRRPDGTLRQVVAGGIQHNDGFSFNLGDLTGTAMARTVDPTGDMDGDGFENLTEVRCGSSPLNPGSVPILVTPLTAPRIGNVFTLQIQHSPAVNQLFIFPWSSNPADFELRSLNVLDGRSFPIHPLAAGSTTIFDPFWLFSTSATFPWNTVFPNTYGLLDGNGQATVSVVIPYVPAIVGASLFSGVLVNDPAALNTAGGISPQITMTILP